MHCVTDITTSILSKCARCQHTALKYSERPFVTLIKRWRLLAANRLIVSPSSFGLLYGKLKNFVQIRVYEEVKVPLEHSMC